MSHKNIINMGLMYTGIEWNWNIRDDVFICASSFPSVCLPDFYLG